MADRRWLDELQCEGRDPEPDGLALKGNVARQVEVKCVFIPFREIHLSVVYHQGNRNLMERAVSPEPLWEVFGAAI